jgi:sulfatase modifying factor 1
VGNPGNAADVRYDPQGFGGVGYNFRIGKYEVTAGQYTEFLNAVAADDANGLFNPSMSNPAADTYGANIQRSGAPGAYSYSVAADWANRPVTYVSFWDTARFANWLHNGQPSGPQGPGTTEDGAYTLTPSGIQFNSVSRNPGARFFIPTKNAGLAATYFDLPTRANSWPGNDITEATNPGNNANYGVGGPALGAPYYRTEVGEFELSASPYGTFDQGGNVWEVNETQLGSARGVRGKSFDDGFALGMWAQFRYPFFTPDREDNNVGFRIASVPEPSTAACAALLVPGALLRFRENARRRGRRWAIA